MSAFTFNYHKTNKSFVAWLLIRFISSNNIGSDQELFNKLSAATDSWKNVEMTMVINGIELDTGAFLASMEESMEAEAQRAAVAKIESIKELDDYRETLDDIGSEIDKLSDVLNTIRKNIAAKHDIAVWDDD